MAKATQTDSVSPGEKQVPLGPACLVVAVFGMVIFSVAMVAASWMLMGNQAVFAARALELQLIPWVEQSSLEPTDRDRILDDLKQLVDDLKHDRLDERQMVRLKLRIADSPVLQWGVIQQAEAKIRSSNLTDEEKQGAELELDRLLRTVSEGKLGMEQLEFLVQPIATKERNSGRLTLSEKADDAGLREFLRRTKGLADKQQIPSEAFAKSPSQVFRSLVEEALAAKQEDKK